MAIANVRNAMTYFLGTFSNVDSAISWLVDDVASIGCEITAVRYAACGYCRGEESEKKVTQPATCRGRNTKQPSVLYNNYSDQITLISSS
jgi:hypothetical protein